jgi:single-stranded-DNA-specific exonuclease
MTFRLKQLQLRAVQSSAAFSLPVHPVLQRIYAHRGIGLPEELQRSAVNLLPFAALKGITEAVVLLTQALDQQQQIIIVGDFDADGATSTAVLPTVLPLVMACHHKWPNWPWRKARN